MQSHPQTFFWQKAALILSSLLLTFLLLEIGMRLGGGLISFLQEHQNQVALQKKSSYRIMCIGESTTAMGGEDSYPSQLKRILNERSNSMTFSVINKGVLAINTSLMLAGLEENLKKYNPDLVIAMIGINDSGPHMPRDLPTTSKIAIFLRSLKTYKLMRLLELHISTKLKELTADVHQLKTYIGTKVKSNEPCGEGDGLILKLLTTMKWKSDREKKLGYINAGNLYRSAGRYVEAEEVYRKLIAWDPSYAQAYLELARLYRDQVQYEPAVANYRKVLALDPKSDYAHNELGRFYRDQLKYAEAEALLNQAIKINPRNGGAYRELAFFYDNSNNEHYNKQSDPVRAEQLYKKAIELDCQDAYGILQLGRFYRERKRYEDAEESFKKSIAVNPMSGDMMGAYVELGRLLREMKRYQEAENSFRAALEIDPKNEWASAGLFVTYHEQGRIRSSEKIVGKAEDQEPRYYNPLTQSNYRQIKKILDRHGIRLICVQYPMRSVKPLKEIFEDEVGIFFVDNEKLFKDAVKEKGYDAYFIDMFGGDFGHCSPEGNHLLAGNIAKTIVNDILKNKK